MSTNATLALEQVVEAQLLEATPQQCKYGEQLSVPCMMARNKAEQLARLVVKRELTPDVAHERFTTAIEMCGGTVVIEGPAVTHRGCGFFNQALPTTTVSEVPVHVANT